MGRLELRHQIGLRRGLQTRENLPQSGQFPVERPGLRLAADQPVQQVG